MNSMTMLVTWNIVRNQRLWTGVVIVVYTPCTVHFIADN